MSKGELTRQHIIQHAATLFNQRGFHGVSMQDIMHATNLQKGGIYRYFDSKEELAICAFDYAYQIFSSGLKRKIEDLTTASDKLNALIEYFQSLAVRPPIPGGCVAMNTAIEYDDGDNIILRERAQNAFQNWHRLVERILEQGIQEKQFREEINTHTVAVTLIALLEGGLMQSRIFNEEAYMTNVVEQIHVYLSTVISQSDNPTKQRITG